MVVYEVTPAKVLGFGRKAGRIGPPVGPRRDVQPDPLALPGHPRGRGTTLMLKEKVAVIYGAGGGIGTAVAHAFAREGARVFLTGQRLAPVERVAKEIEAEGSSAEAAEVDSLDETALGDHLRSVIEEAGRLDISFNAVGVPNAEDPRRAAGRSGRRAVRPAACGLGHLILPDRSPGRAVHRSPAWIRRDHDRHRRSLRDRLPPARGLRSGAGRQGGAHPFALRRAGTLRDPV